MLNSVTFGQFYPVESVVHRLDARTKILLTIGIIVMLYVANGFVAIGVTATFVIFVYALSHVPFRLALHSVKAILPLIIFMSVLNVLYLRGNTVLWQWWAFTITVEGIIKATYMVARIILLITATSLLTYSTSPIDLTDGIERLFKPLSYIKVPVHDLAMIMTIALRFIPTLMDEADKIISAQKARGADIDTGNFVKRIKSLIPILIPLLVSAIRRSDELATAMNCRCYQGGEGRTQMKQAKLSLNDLIASITYTAVLTGVILINAFVVL